MDSTLLEQIADNWLLVFLFTLFMIVIVWAFRPGSRSKHDDAANLPFRNEDAPKADKPAQRDEDKKAKP